MVENAYTREASIRLTELVPDKDMLPRCHGWKADGLQCRNTAKYEMDGRPLCAVHIKPNAIFMPEKWVTE